MGINCQYLNKPHTLSKRIEIEALLDELLKLQYENKIELNPNISAEFIAESNKRRGNFRSKILSEELQIAAKELRDNPNIVIRKADKSQLYVILDKCEYFSKINDILQDETKFKAITRDPTTVLKTKINKIITGINASMNNLYLPKIIGDFKPGYMYGNVKIHKEGNLLRPIISQIPTATYNLAKTLNNLIRPYTPSCHTIKSSKDFLDIIHHHKPSGIMASVDVESLFTNVPVDETINMICDKVYRGNKPPLKIPEIHLRSLLQACTTEAPFFAPDGRLFIQTDGIAMGSPLGVLFADFYMGCIEEKVFESHQNLLPEVYLRYIDDTFLEIKDTDCLKRLIKAFHEESVLKFTHEIEKENTLNFLDVNVTRESERYCTSVYVKDTNVNICLNPISECPERYKQSVISAYINRTITHCSSWSSWQTEVERVTNMLINNGYKKYDIDNAIKLALNRMMNNEDQCTADNEIKVYYRAYMCTAYKAEEQAIKDIVKRNVKPTDSSSNIKLLIYYRNEKTANLIMKNNPVPTVNPMEKTGVVYKYKCPVTGCKQCYIGMTTTTLSRRLTGHLQQGAIKNHNTSVHEKVTNKKDLEDNTVILGYEKERKKLSFLELLYINAHRPMLNLQGQGTGVLPSAGWPKNIHPTETALNEWW